MEKILGYDCVDGKLVVNPVESEIVKFTFEKTIQYTDHPPIELVGAVIEEYRNRGEDICYEEAEVEVSYSEILEYITREIKLKHRLYSMLATEPDAEKMRELLELSYEEAERRLVRLCVGVQLPESSKTYTAECLKKILECPKETGSASVSTSKMEQIVPTEVFEAVRQQMIRKKAADAGIGLVGEDENLRAGGSLCEFCGQRKLIADGCTCSEVICNGKKYKRIPYGQEDGMPAMGKSCHDCGVTLGRYHHPGCDAEECPACGGQLIGCACVVEYETDDE